MKKTICLILCLLMLLCTLPMASVSAASDEVIVLAGSDFQVTELAKGSSQVKTITRRMYYDGISSFDGLLFCGDFTNSLEGKKEDSKEGYDALMSVLDPLVGNHRVFVKGNHDPEKCEFLSPSGANDAAAYGTFVINESDFCWPSSVWKPEERVKRTKAIAAKLETYLKEKIDSGYNKPIFVVSHVPLHYTFRTKTAGDSDQANFIFDVLNAAGDKLNIFFLFGHNHNNGWDDYLGGGAIYLKKGDSINIAQSSMTEFKEETLKFTYMNAGYVGYYNNHNQAYGELTMSVFRIKGNDVTVARYSMKGMVDLKAKGVRNAYKGEEGYAVNTDVYASPRLVTLGGDVQVSKPTTTTAKKTTTTVATTTKKSNAGLVGGVTTTKGAVITTTATTAAQQQQTTVAGAATTTVQMTDVTTTVLPDAGDSTEIVGETTTVAESVNTTTTTAIEQTTGGEPSGFPVAIVVIAAVVVVAGAAVAIVLISKKKAAK